MAAISSSSAVSAMVISSAREDWRHITLPPVLWLSSAALLASSLTFEGAKRAVRRRGAKEVRNWVLLTVLLGAAFLAAQLAGWSQMLAQGVVLRGQRHGGHLGLVAHFCEEEGRQRRGEDPGACGELRVLLIETIRHQRPGRHGKERHAQHPAHRHGTGQVHEPGPYGRRDGVIDDGGGKDAGHDGPRLAKPRGQDEREQLRLVAHFGEPNQPGGDEK